MKSKQTTITLIEGEEESLVSIASKLGVKSRSGPSSGKPTWRELIHQIAAGQLVVNRPSQNVKAAIPEKKKGRKLRPFKAWAKYPPKWWKPNFMGQMSVEAAVEGSGRTAEELEKGGLPRLGDDFFGLEEWAHLIPNESVEDEFEEEGEA